MAERKTEEDFNPRHRIVGAVILVALAVIFLPLLLQDRPPEKDEASSSEARDVPSPANTAKPRPDAPRPAGIDPATTRPGTRTVTVALDPADAGSPARKPVTDVAVIADTPKAESRQDATPAKSEPKVEVRTEPKAETRTRAETKARAKPETAIDPRASGWYVQVGAFSQADNARRLQEKLVAKGFHVVTEPPRIEHGKTIKVEVGPYKDQSAARSAASRIKTDLGVDGVVRKH